MSRIIAPSILSFELPNLKQAVEELVDLEVPVIHLDIMDGQFVPPITFGDSFASYVHGYAPQTLLEAHLMTLTPDQHFEAFARSGCGRILFHVEATNHAYRHAQTLHEMGLESGIVLNPGTPVGAVLPLLEVVDMVLVMTVNPGWGGQKFIEGSLARIAQIRAASATVKIEVDGGMNPGTIARCAEAGADVFVVGNYLASARDMRLAYKEVCG